MASDAVMGSVLTETWKMVSTQLFEACWGQRVFGSPHLFGWNGGLSFSLC